MSNEMKTMKTIKSLKVDVGVRKEFIVTLHGEPIGVFYEKSEMSGMRLLRSIGTGQDLVLDMPTNFLTVLSEAFGHGENPKYEATVIKLSSDLMTVIQKVIDKNTKADEGDGPADSDSEPPNTTCEEG